MSRDTAEIIRRFDALHLRVELFSCTDGTVGASAPNADIRQKHTIAGLTGYGETAELAVMALWTAVEDMGREDLLLIRRDDTRRYYRWNGAAWKEEAAADWGVPA